MWSKILDKEQLYPDAIVRVVNNLNENIYTLEYRLVKWSDGEVMLEPLAINNNQLKEEMRVRFTIAFEDLLKGQYEIESDFSL